MMKQKMKLLRIVNLVLGMISIAFFVFDTFVFLRLQPKMVAFVPLTHFEKPLLTWIGVGLLILLLFYLLSVLQLASFMKQADRVRGSDILLLILGVVAGVLVFSDVALFSDINKQYLAGFDQPEWSLVYPIMGFQLVIVLVYMVFHLSGKWQRKSAEKINRDVNIFLMVQYVGLVCGLMGLSIMSLGFFYPSGWNLLTHTLITGAILTFPYILSLGYWLVTKLSEKDRQLFDEKQRLDVGKSAFLTLIIITFLMFGVFLYNLGHLEGVIRMLWFPLYLFNSLFIFSLGNLFFSRRG